MSELPFLAQYPTHRTRSRSALLANETWYSRLEKFECADPQNVTVDCNSVEFDKLALGVVTSTGYRVWKYDPDNFALFVVLSGEVSVDAGGESKSAKEGQAILIPPGRRVSSPKDGCVSAFLAIQAGPVASEEGVLSLPMLSMDEGGSLGRIAIALLTELSHRPTPPSARAIESWQSLLSVEVSDALFNAGAFREQIREASLRQVKQAEDYIAGRLDEVLTISAIADHLGISNRSLQLAFRRHRAVSPHQYIANERLAQVRSRLMQAKGEDTVTSIALDNGITSLGRFATRYRAAYGERPSETLARALRRNDGTYTRHRST